MPFKLKICNNMYCSQNVSYVWIAIESNREKSRRFQERFLYIGISVVPWPLTEIINDFPVRKSCRAEKLWPGFAFKKYQHGPQNFLQHFS